MRSTISIFKTSRIFNLSLIGFWTIWDRTSSGMYKRFHSSVRRRFDIFQNARPILRLLATLSYHSFQQPPNHDLPERYHSAEKGFSSHSHFRYEFLAIETHFQNVCPSTSICDFGNYAAAISLTLKTFYWTLFFWSSSKFAIFIDNYVRFFQSTGKNFNQKVIILRAHFFHLHFHWITLYKGPLTRRNWNFQTNFF